MALPAIDSLLARPGVLHDLGEGRVVEAHHLIDHSGDLFNVGLVGHQRLLRRMRVYCGSLSQFLVSGFACRSSPATSSYSLPSAD